MESAPPPVTPTARRLPRMRSAFLAAVLGWVLPGLGHLYVGRPLKALLLFAAIVPTFGIGLALTGFTAVDPEAYPLEFIAHACLGGPTAVAMRLAEDRYLEALPRWFDMGRLYAAVAGLLNVVAISDALGEVIRHNRRVQAERRHREAVERAAWVEILPPDGGGAAHVPDGEPAEPPPAGPETGVREAPVLPASVEDPGAPLAPEVVDSPPGSPTAGPEEVR